MTTEKTTALAAEATSLSPADIVPHPMNPRESAAPDEGLIASVREMGVLERLVLAPVPADLPDHARRLLVPEAEFLLIAGHRRLEAAYEADLESVPVDIRHDLDTTEKQLAAIAAENVHRSDLSALEEGDLYLALGDLGLTQAQISERTSVRKVRVSERTRVAKLPTSAREKLASHQITLDAALTLTLVGDDPDEVARIAAQPVYVWEQEVRRVLAAREREREDARKAKDLAAAGVTVLEEFPPTPDVEEGDDQAAAWWRLDDLLDVAYEGISRATAQHKDPTVAPSDNVDELDVDFDDVEAWHQATCKGHQVVKQQTTSWQGPSTSWVPICTTPATHDALVDGPQGGSLAEPVAARHKASPSAVAQEREENPAAKARREHLKAREDQRAAWAAALLDDATGRVEESMRRVLGAELRGYGRPGDDPWQVAARRKSAIALGLHADASAEELQDRLDDIAAHGALGQIALALQLLDHGNGADAMTTPGGWGMHWAAQRARLFHALGWLWDEQELDEIREAGHPALVSIVAEDEDDATEGEVA